MTNSPGWTAGRCRPARRPDWLLPAVEDLLDDRRPRHAFTCATSRGRLRISTHVDRARRERHHQPEQRRHRRRPCTRFAGSLVVALAELDDQPTDPAAQAGRDLRTTTPITAPAAPNFNAGAMYGTRRREPQLEQRAPPRCSEAVHQLDGRRGGSTAARASVPTATGKNARNTPSRDADIHVSHTKPADVKLAAPTDDQRSERDERDRSAR